MNGFTSFFLFCAGADKSILKRTPTDVNKYASIGATVFFTGIFAMIAGAYAIHTVFDSLIVSIVFGLLWGLMIFNLDRYIVMSIKKKDKWWSEVGMALPRMVLAILIAFVIAKPLELKLFESEINAELVFKEQEKYKQQEEALRNRFTGQLEQLKTDVDQLNLQIESKRKQRDDLNMMAIQEADGTGGSGNRNIGPIYRAKKRDADLAQKELEATIATLSPEIATKKDRISTIEQEMKEALESMDRVALSGFAARLDALGSISKKSTTIFWASIFITLLFIAIETAPLFVKLITERSPYDFRLDQHESLAMHRHASYVHKLNVMNRNVKDSLTQIERCQTLEAINAEKLLIKSVIKSELEALKDKPLSWQAYKEMGRKFV